MTRLCDRAFFGGSFDPVHSGHISIIRFILQSEAANHVEIVPAAISPFKLEKPPAPAEDRLRMLELALRNVSLDFPGRVILNDFELRKGPPSYTFASLEEMRRSYKNETIGLVLGSDSLTGFSGWKNPSDILAHHPLLVFQRKGDLKAALLDKIEKIKIETGISSAAIHILENPLFDCSSTEVRSHLPGLREDDPLLAKCLPEGVRDYILEKRLYQSR